MNTLAYGGLTRENGGAHTAREEVAQQGDLIYGEVKTVVRPLLLRPLLLYPPSSCRRLLPNDGLPMKRLRSLSVD